jgi:hypothetical protein
VLKKVHEPSAAEIEKHFAYLRKEIGKRNEKKLKEQ